MAQHLEDEDEEVVCAGLVVYLQPPSQSYEQALGRKAVKIDQRLSCLRRRSHTSA